MNRIEDLSSVAEAAGFALAHSEEIADQPAAPVASPEDAARRSLRAANTGDSSTAASDQRSWRLFGWLMALRMPSSRATA